ncbi:MAG TPA: hypothetical protein VF064_12945 [Pyrinomonadaceae bacterium]
MTYKVIVRPEAEREIREAFDWYEERSEGLGLEFLRAADACLSGVRRNPEAYPLVQEQARRALLQNSRTRFFTSSAIGQSLSSHVFTSGAALLIGNGASDGSMRTETLILTLNGFASTVS